MDAVDVDRLDEIWRRVSPHGVITEYGVDTSSMSLYTTNLATYIDPTNRRRRRRRPPRTTLADARGPDDAPSIIAMKRVGQAFDEGDSNSSVMIVLEGQNELGDDAHKYYD